MTDQDTKRPEPPRTGFGRRAPSATLGLLIFGFGATAGFMIAFSGLGLFDDSAGIILLVFLAVLMFISALGLVLFLFRKPLWRRLFGLAETQLELFAGPLSDVARGAVDRDPQRATDAARDLVNMALARYAWVSTRRWVIGSLTALIAAMAALAGTALLFRQNELLGAQNDRIDVQITQLDQQIELDGYDVQLAEAARNAQLVVEITAIAQALGEAADRSSGPVETAADFVAVLDPIADLPRGLVLRIASASQATKPYKFLATGLRPENHGAMMQAAMALRPDLPQTRAQMANAFRWPEVQTGTRLIDRPASPERGQLLRALTASGLRELEVLNFYGMDLSYAYAPGVRLYLLSAQMGQFSYADLSFANVFESQFGGAWLSHTRFRQAYLRDTDFGAVPGDLVKPPFSGDLPFFATQLDGADFSDAVLQRVGFVGSHAVAARFDDATLIAPDFRFATISAATFRNAALLNPQFEGADLRSVDFDGAIVTGADFLETLTEIAAPNSFRADRYQLAPITNNDALDHIDSLYRFVDADTLTSLSPNGLYRVTRIAPFEN